jgi:adenylate cyclase
MESRIGQSSGARLVEKGGAGPGYELAARFTIGRSSKSNLVVKSNQISRLHAELRALSGGLYCVIDCGSRNGTFVNGERVTGSRVLRDGDEIGVGELTLCFSNGGVAESTAGLSQSTNDTTDIGLDDRVAVTLVSDIRGYTTLTQRLGKPFQAFVAEWFRAVVELIRREGGCVDKIHGDGLLAYWWVADKSALTETVGPVLRTCDAMLALRDRFARRLHSELRTDGFAIGIGLHVGDVMLGNLGTGAVHAFTVVGDAVNLTFRLEELTKATGHPVLLSDDVARHAPRELALEDVGEVSLRGRSGRLRVWALTGYERRPLPPLLLQHDDEATDGVPEPPSAADPPTRG